MTFIRKNADCGQKEPADHNHTVRLPFSGYESQIYTTFVCMAAGKQRSIVQFLQGILCLRKTLL